jgi:dienelactone hydrolase
MEASTVRGDLFLHQVFTLHGTGGTPHIVFEGDGQAFLDRYTVARDPTPAKSAALAMAPEIGAYGPVHVVGRPCYHSLEDAACNPIYWTIGRHAPEVIASLVTAIRKLTGTRKVWLVGYSGGGTLAVLVAAAMPDQVLGVLTIAAPLDTLAWTQYHGYTPLSKSVDPSDDLPRYTHSCQRHLLGSKDKTIPEKLHKSWRWPDTDLQVVSGLSHTSDWNPALTSALADLHHSCNPSSENSATGYTP